MSFEVETPYGGNTFPSECRFYLAHDGTLHVTRDGETPTAVFAPGGWHAAYYTTDDK